MDSERTDAEAIRHTVVEEEVEVKLKQAETQHLKDDAQKDLEHVSVHTVEYITELIELF